MIWVAAVAMLVVVAMVVPWRRVPLPALPKIRAAWFWRAIESLDRLASYRAQKVVTYVLIAIGSGVLVWGEIVVRGRR